MLVQDYLKTHSLEELKSEHGVNYRVDSHKFNLNYDMLEAKDSDPIACECRGIVLMRPDGSTVGPNDIVGETIVLCRTMNRFFNLGQSCAANIDFQDKHTKFYEKLDGSMTAVYYDSYKKAWCVGTRSVPEANLPVDGFGEFTFRTLFEEALKHVSGYDFEQWVVQARLNKDVTYVFELCTPLNQIVVKHDDYFVVLLAARHSNGQEIAIESLAKSILTPICESYELSSMEDMIDFVKSRDPSNHEGIVAMDSNFNRVKVKNPSYLALARIKESAVRAPRGLIELCLLGKLDDAEGLLPNHIRERAHKIKNGLVDLVRNADKDYIKALQEVEEKFNWGDEKKQRKEFALICKRDNLDMAYMMQRYSGKCENYQDWIDKHANPETGSYPKGFLDSLLRTVERKYC